MKTFTPLPHCLLSIFICFVSYGLSYSNNELDRHDDFLTITIACPPDITINCHNSIPIPDVNLVTVLSTTCSNPAVTVTHLSDVQQILSCVNEYRVIRTYQATDACLNVVNCVQLIDVIDVVSPAITCPNNVIISCSSSTLPVFTGLATATDNCSGPVIITNRDAIIPGICPNNYTIMRTYFATDLCANSSSCVQVISVGDNIGPAITCPQSIAVSCTSLVPLPNVATVTATDNCTGSSIIAHGGDVVTNQTCANNKTISRTYFATDACGNSSSCVQVISVNDNIGPAITCPSNIVVNCTSLVPPPNTATVTATDNCTGSATITHGGDAVSNQTCVNKKTISRTYFATDACGNSSSCVQIISVDDNIPPTLNCPPNVTIVCDTYSFSASATDNCSGSVNITYSHPPGSTFPQGVTTVNVTAIDACGNSSVCSFTVTSYLGTLANYHMVFTNGSQDINLQAPSKGFIGDIAIDGIQGIEKTSGTIPYAGTMYTNAGTLSNWQNIINANPGQAFSSLNQNARLTQLENELETAFALINALPVTSGYNGITPVSLNNLNTQNGIAEQFVMNINSSFTVSTKINITGDFNDLFILRWDTDKIFSNGYDGIVRFQNGGAIVPLGGLNASHFIHVAGDLKSSNGGSNPAPPYPQGPRTNNGTGSLINGGSNFSGGGFFTGYWLTTGDPTISNSGQPYGKTSALTNAIFVGGLYSKTTKMPVTAGTSGVYVSACTNGGHLPIGNPVDVEPEENEASVESILIHAWPNPSDNQFTLEIESNKDEKFEIHVYDLLGKQVLKMERDNDQPLDFGAELLPGIYFIQIRQGNNFNTTKIVKQFE